uniref:Uncharacterized protein n=1 Tax=Perkinsus marinus TaxID=31276 RepID=C9VXM8_9ALVE|nr:unknown protein [Perkinsus marinus]
MLPPADCRDAEGEISNGQGPSLRFFGDSNSSNFERDDAFKVKPTLACLLEHTEFLSSNAAMPVLVQGVAVGVDYRTLPMNVAPYLRITDQGFVPLRMLPPDMAGDQESVEKLIDMSKLCGLTIKSFSLSSSSSSFSSSSSSSSSRKRPRETYPKLGNRGRVKLRGMIAAAVKGHSREWKLSRGIRDLKSARVKDLIRMADELGLSEYIDTVALT